MLSVIIIEDEQHCADRLIRLLRNNSEQFEIVGQFDNIKDAREGLIQLNPHLVFMDVELKDGNCFELLQQIDRPSFKIIFTTAHNEYAIQAFEYSAIHYLLKPIDSERLTQAIRRFTNADKIQKTNDRLESLIHNLEAHSSQDKKIAVPTTKGLNFYKLGEIVRFEGDGNYCSVVLTTGEELLVTKQLKYYEALLDKRLFFRTHQSHLVHLAFVERYMNSGNTFVKLTNQDEIPVSVRRRAEFFKLLAENQQI